MSMLDAAYSAAVHLFSWGPILGMLCVLPVALLSGIMPGGGLPVSAVVLGFVGFLDPWVAITIVVFHMAASDTTDPIPAIILGIPGSRATQATVLDGYPMAKQGLAGIALGASYTTNMIGGLIGAAALLLSLPLARETLNYFSSAEFFLFSMMGVMAVGIVSSGAVAKGMLTAALGFAIDLIGYSPIGGVIRLNLGIEYLWSGVPIIPVVIGLFAIPEAIDLVVGNTPVAKQRVEQMLRDAQKDVYKGMRIALDHFWLIVRTSLIGTFIGAIPGLGAGVGHWIAYAHARATEEGAKETFGKGDVRGVIASDAANNSSDGAVLIPTVAFGIPGSGGMVLVLAMLILYGITPGQQMLTTNLDLTMSLVYTVALANVVTIPVVLLFSSQIVKMAAVPPNVLAPIVIALVSLAAFQASFTMGDMVSVLAFSVLGIFMKRYGWPRPPILIAVVLGETVEKYLWLSTQSLGWSMLLRPQFLIVGALIVITVWLSLRMQKSASVASTEVQTDFTADAQRGETHSASLGTSPARIDTKVLRREVIIELVGESVLLAFVALFFGLIVAEATGLVGGGWPLGAALTPCIAIAIGTPFLLYRTHHVFRIALSLDNVPRLLQTNIMDVGFRIGEDPEGERRRFARITIAIGVLYAGIWLVGFHLAVPLWVFGYLYFFSDTGLRSSMAMGVLFLAMIVGLYDFVMGTPWNEPIFPWAQNWIRALFMAG
jgi:TctA family transporter